MLLDIDLKPAKSLAAIDDAGGQLTYGDIVNLRNQLADILPSRELVFCLCENRVGALAGFLTLYDCKNVCLLLSAHIDTRHIAHPISGCLKRRLLSFHTRPFTNPKDMFSAKQAIRLLRCTRTCPC